MAEKVVVVGPGEAGKSTLVSRVGSQPMNLSHRGRTVAMDHGTLLRGERRAYLIGLPGQPRFAPVREALLTGAAAVVWVHPEGDLADAWTLDLLAGPLNRLPYLVLVNRRKGAGVAQRFSAPPTLPPPREVLVADLFGDAAALKLVEEAIWRLLE